MANNSNNTSDYLNPASQVMIQQIEEANHNAERAYWWMKGIDREAAKQRAEHLKQQLEGTGYTLSSPEDRRKERILIASFAMQGMIANDRFYDALLDKGNHAKALAVTSLKFADALLAEVDKEKGGSDD